eukprot:TRINITY_DN103946_c0_g1_i1.p1 TRINITY_DN103946_c0_g1~~TRINITY_DN103946_c0_g1_i1.p1  ORF type:complete len:385 (+),score=75.14 TRINITY_DN103946_c0_g1_i1:98-1252(+)
MAPTSLSVVFQYGIGEKGKGITSDGRRVLEQPRGLHLAEDGTLYVADFGNYCVVRYGPSDAKGRVVAGEPGKQLGDVDYLKDIDGPLKPADGEGYLLKNPVDVALDHQGRLLVLDCGKARVQRFEPVGANSQPGKGEIVVPHRNAPNPKSFSAPEALKQPRAMLRDRDGSLVICDTWSHRLLRFLEEPEDGSNIRAAQEPQLLAGTSNSTEAVPEKLCYPSSMVLCDDGSVLVSDTNNHRIQRFETGKKEGKTIAGSEKGQAGNGLGELNMPAGICLDPTDGSLLVADKANARLLRFRSGSRAGDPGELLAGPELLQRPWGVVVGSDGAVYVSDERQAVVLKLAAAGSKADSAGYAAASPPPAPAVPTASVSPPPGDAPDMGLD